MLHNHFTFGWSASLLWCKSTWLVSLHLLRTIWLVASQNISIVISVDKSTLLGSKLRKRLIERVYCHPSFFFSLRWLLDYMNPGHNQIFVVWLQNWRAIVEFDVFVDGAKLHLDGSWFRANATRQSYSHAERAKWLLFTDEWMTSDNVITQRCQVSVSFCHFPPLFPPRYHVLSFFLTFFSNCLCEFSPAGFGLWTGGDV